MRSLAPPRFGEDATYYLAVNRHRRNVVADLRDPRDFATVAELVAPGRRRGRELPTESGTSPRHRPACAPSNPECVWVSITPATEGGPVADQPSFDLLAQARSGLMGVTGEPDGAPTKVGAPIADVVTGLYGAVGLLTGLFARRERSAGPSLRSAASGVDYERPGEPGPGLPRTGVNPRAPGQRPSEHRALRSGYDRRRLHPARGRHRRSSTRDWSRCSRRASRAARRVVDQRVARRRRVTSCASPGPGVRDAHDERVA